MAEILVLVEHNDGASEGHLELLTLACSGEPSAVFIGSGVDAAAATLAGITARRKSTSPTHPNSPITWRLHRSRCARAAGEGRRRRRLF